MARYGEYGTPRQRDKFGGINWGAAFFGWLVAVGIGALLTALLPRVERFELGAVQPKLNNVLHGLGTCVVTVR